MKRIISLFLTIVMLCCNGIVVMADSGGVAKITSPSDGEWLDPHKTITVNWSTPSTGLTYKVTIQNEGTGKYITQNEKVSTNYYNIKPNTLDFEERYKICVETFNGTQSLGKGNAVTIKIYDRLSSEKVYQEAEFSYPANNQTVSADQDLNIKLNIDSDLEYWLTIRDLTDDRDIVNDIGNTSTYTVKKSLLKYGHSYKAWVGTRKKASVEKKLLGGGKSINFKTENEVKKTEPTLQYEAATIEYPKNNAKLDPEEKIMITWNTNHDDLKYSVTIKDVNTSEYIADNEITSKSYFVVPANTFKRDHKYEVILKTLNGNKQIGESDQRYFYTNYGSDKKTVSVNATKEAIFTNPEDGGIINYKKDVTLKWKAADIQTYYELSVKDLTTGEYLTQNELVSDTSYRINSSKLKAKHQYKAWIGTYSNKTEDRRFIGKGDEVFFETDGTIPVLITSMSADKNDNGLEFTYKITGEEFGWAEVTVKDSKGKVYFDDKTYDLNGVALIENSNLSSGTTYICEVQTYSSQGEKAAYKSYKYTFVREKGKYDDVSENHKNYKAIKQLSVDGVLAGDGSGKFRPYDSITRAEFVKIICQTFGLKMKTKNKTFSDVKSHWAESFIYTAASHNLIAGVDEKNFAPNNNITYQQIAKIIVIQKGWENNALKLGGYPDGYVKVMINNNLFDNSEVKTSAFETSEFYNKPANRADVAQIAYNAKMYTGADKTVIPKDTDIDGATPYRITNDIGQDVTGAKNPTPQQIYNYVYNRIKEREVYKKDPNVLNAIMAMIWTESNGKHYTNGKIVCSSNVASKDYGICQLNDKVYPEAKYWGWRENLNAGIDKYATAYWMCMGEEGQYKAFAQSVEKALQANKAQSYQDARARSAYCMYNHNNDARERWFTKNDNRDTNYYAHYTKKNWAQTLIATGNSIPVTKPEEITTTTGKRAFEEVLKQTAKKHIGNTYKEYVSSDSTAWCVYCATKIAQEAIIEYGVPKQTANNIVPIEGSTSGLIKYYKRDQYHNYTDYTSVITGVSYTKVESGKSYMPKVGDFVFLETGTKNSSTGKDNPGPDHTELIIEVDKDRMTFTTVAGNTSNPTVCEKHYEYNESMQKWTRKGSTQNYVHGFITPDYPN